MSDPQQRIDQLVKSSDVLLFMKGNASFPMCGFSGRAIQILKACGVDPKAVNTVNVLEDDEIRQGIKEYSNWPTIPQLYVKGEFIGGSDIMMEMYQSGELQQVLGKHPAADDDPERGFGQHAFDGASVHADCQCRQLLTFACAHGPTPLNSGTAYAGMSMQVLH